MDIKIKTEWKSEGLKKGFKLGLIIDIFLLGYDWLFDSVKQCGFWDKIYCSWSEYFKEMWGIYLFIGILIIFVVIIISLIIFKIQSLRNKK